MGIHDPLAVDGCGVNARLVAVTAVLQFLPIAQKSIVVCHACPLFASCKRRRSLDAKPRPPTSPIPRPASITEPFAFGLPAPLEQEPISRSSLSFARPSLPE